MAMRPTVKRLAQLRKARGITQLELALLIGVVPGTIHMWERGRAAPTRLHLDRLADAFQVTPGYLWGWRERRRAEPAPETHLRLVA